MRSFFILVFFFSLAAITPQANAFYMSAGAGINAGIGMWGGNQMCSPNMVGGGARGGMRVPSDVGENEKEAIEQLNKQITAAETAERELRTRQNELSRKNDDLRRGLDYAMGATEAAAANNMLKSQDYRCDKIGPSDCGADKMCVPGVDAAFISAAGCQDGPRRLQAGLCDKYKKPYAASTFLEKCRKAMTELGASHAEHNTVTQQIEAKKEEIKGLKAARGDAQNALTSAITNWRKAALEAGCMDCLTGGVGGGNFAYQVEDRPPAWERVGLGLLGIFGGGLAGWAGSSMANGLNKQWTNLGFPWRVDPTAAAITSGLPFAAGGIASAITAGWGAGGNFACMPGMPGMWGGGMNPMMMGGVNPMMMMGGGGYPFMGGYPGMPFGPGFMGGGGMNPFAMNPFASMMPGFGAGFGMNPMMMGGMPGMNPFMNPFAMGGSPFGNPFLGAQIGGGFPGMINPMMMGGIPGMNPFMGALSAQIGGGFSPFSPFGGIGGGLNLGLGGGIPGLMPSGIPGFPGGYGGFPGLGSYASIGGGFGTYGTPGIPPFIGAAGGYPYGGGYPGIGGGYGIGGGVDPYGAMARYYQNANGRYQVINSLTREMGSLQYRLQGAYTGIGTSDPGYSYGYGNSYLGGGVLGGRTFPGTSTGGGRY